MNGAVNMATYTLLFASVTMIGMPTAVNDSNSTKTNNEIALPMIFLRKRNRWPSS